MGRTEREWPGPPRETPDRPPGHPPVVAFDPPSSPLSRVPSPAAPTLSLRATVWAHLFHPGGAPHFWLRGPTIHIRVDTNTPHDLHD